LISHCAPPAEALQGAQAPAEPHAFTEVPATQVLGVPAASQQLSLHDNPPAQLVPHTPVAESQASPVAQSALVVQVAKQAVPLQAYAPHEVTVAEGQLPWPSQVAAAVCEQVPEAQAQEAAGPHDEVG
jgi:hypothetical protein